MFSNLCAFVHIRKLVFGSGNFGDKREGETSKESKTFHVTRIQKALLTSSSFLPLLAVHDSPLTNRKKGLYHPPTDSWEQVGALV